MIPDNMPAGYRDIGFPSPREERAEDAMDEYVAAECAAANEFHSALIRFRAAVEAINSDMGWLDGYSKEDVVAILDQWTAPDPAKIADYAENHAPDIADETEDF